MQISLAESPKRSESRPLERSDVAAGGADTNGISKALSARQLESLMLNLDASLRVHARSHFFSWTQGLLQSLIRHEVLICALRDGKPLSFRVDSFSTTAADPGIFGETFVRDASVAPTLVKVWEEGRFRPVVLQTNNCGPLAAGAFARELGRIGATQLVAHGTHDADGLVSSFFVFGCTAATLTPAQPYLSQLVVPFLHSAWMRAQVAGRTKCDDGPKSAAGTNITSREQEILRWMYLGKSNPEMGAILNISTFTAKNHVQKILRKLNVVSRAQAVGKALELRILSLDGGASGLVVPPASGSARRPGKMGRAEADRRVPFT